MQLAMGKQTKNPETNFTVVFFHVLLSTALNDKKQQQFQLLICSGLHHKLLTKFLVRFFFNDSNLERLQETWTTATANERLPFFKARKWVIFMRIKGVIYNNDL